MKFKDVRSRGQWHSALLYSQTGEYIGWIFGTGSRRDFDPFTKFVASFNDDEEDVEFETRREAKKYMREEAKKRGYE